LVVFLGADTGVGVAFLAVAMGLGVDLCVSVGDDFGIDDGGGLVATVSTETLVGAAFGVDVFAPPVAAPITAKTRRSVIEPIAIGKKRLRLAVVASPAKTPAPQIAQNFCPSLSGWPFAQRNFI
jgi:hypothetical protein